MPDSPIPRRFDALEPRRFVVTVTDAYQHSSNPPVRDERTGLRVDPDDRQVQILLGKGDDVVPDDPIWAPVDLFEPIDADTVFTRPLPGRDYTIRRTDDGAELVVGDRHRITAVDTDTARHMVEKAEDDFHIARAVLAFLDDEDDERRRGAVDVYARQLLPWQLEVAGGRTGLETLIRAGLLPDDPTDD